MRNNIKEANCKTNKRIHIQIEFLIILLAFAIGINSQFTAFVNRYVINDDVNQNIYWMQQFRDNSLFRNDLLTEYAKNYQPWGLVALYYMFSFVMCPIIISKILPIILLALSSLYVFKLLKQITNSNYTGFLGSFILMITPVFLGRMVGGHAHAFGYPLIIAFLYYLVKKEYLKSSVIMILQCLFYPIIFLLSALTYLFTFIRIRYKNISFDKSNSKRMSFILGMLICFSILSGKYIFTYNPSIGTTVTRRQIVNNPAFYAGGRCEEFPTAPLAREVGRNVERGTFFHQVLKRHTKIVPIKIIMLNSNVILILVVLFLISEIVKRKIVFPPEILFLFFSSILMYKISDLLLLKLFLPTRYLQYSIPTISLIIFTIAIGQLITNIESIRIKRVFQIVVVVLILLNLNINKKVSLIDMSYDKNLYEYLSSLPKDAMIAAHPYLADGIPTFAQIKVFIKYELSYPFFDNYWETIKKRTFDFFDAYYSEDPGSIYRFCEENGVDYLVVKKGHFTKEYLMREKMYFNPFNTYIIDITRKRPNFALKDVPERDKLFAKDDIFVIKKESLRINSF